MTLSSDDFNNVELQILIDSLNNLIISRRIKGDDRVRAISMYDALRDEQRDRFTKAKDGRDAV